MKVEDVVAFVRARHPDARSPEAQIDRFVSRVGGQKEPGIDLKDVRRQVIGRLLRRPRPAPKMVYVCPRRCSQNADDGLGTSLCQRQPSSASFKLLRARFVAFLRAPPRSRRARQGDRASEASASAVPSREQESPPCQ